MLNSRIPIPTCAQKLKRSRFSVVDFVANIQAYGYNGLGLIVISDVPTLPEKRESLLPLAFEFSKVGSKNIVGNSQSAFR